MWLSHHWLLAGLLAWFCLSLPFGIMVGRLLRAAGEPPERPLAQHSSPDAKDAEAFLRKSARS